MSKISLNTVTNGQNISNINSNFSAIADALNSKVLYRNNPAGEPNQMSNSLDMNGNDILNAGHVSSTGITVDGVDLTQELDGIAASVAQAQAAAAASSQSATDSQVAASTVQSLVPTINGAAQKANNLSDLPSPSTARTSLGLGSVDNTSDVNKPVSTAQATALALKLDVATATSTYAPKASPTFTGTVVIPTVTITAGAIAGVTLSGAAITNSPISGNAGSFTTLNATTSVGGAGFTAFMASPPAIGATAASTGKFTTLQSTSAAKVFSFNNTSQSFTSGTAATVAGWTALTDANSNFNIVTGVFTAPSAGYYLVSAQLVFAVGAAAAGTVFQALVAKNGAALASGWVTLAATAQSSISVPVSIVVSLVAADTIVIQGKQNSGASLTLTGGGTINFLSITQVP